jgi:DNA modification methylase
MRRGLAETPRPVWGERQVVQLSGEDRVVPEPVAFTLYRGDCLKELRKLTDASVQLVVTSPPYAEARKSSYGGTHPDRYVRWFVPRAEQLRRVLRPTGSFVLVIKDSVVRGERHRYVMDLVLALRDQGWLHTETWIWHKRNCAPGKWPNRFRDAFEYVFQFNLNRRFDMYQDAVRVPVGDWARTRLNGLSETDWTQDRSKTGSKFAKNVSRWVGRNTVYPTNVVGISSECGNVGHPAAFPVALPDFFVRLFTRPGDVVLDPFAGSGTTGVAALRLGREFVGIDTREDYLTIAHERLADALAAGDESGSVGDGGNSETTMSRLARNR